MVTKTMKKKIINFLDLKKISQNHIMKDICFFLKLVCSIIKKGEKTHFKILIKKMCLE